MWNFSKPLPSNINVHQFPTWVWWACRRWKMVDCQRSLSCLIACNASVMLVTSRQTQETWKIFGLWLKILGGWERPTQLIGPIYFLSIFSTEVIHPLGIYILLRILEPFVEWSQVTQRILDHALRETPCSLGSAIETLRWAAGVCWKQ